METGTRTKARNQIIAAFLKENNFYVWDLAKYLEIEYQYGCYKESKMDWIARLEQQLLEQLKLKVFLMELEEKIINLEKL